MLLEQVDQCRDLLLLALDRLALRCSLDRRLVEVACVPHIERLAYLSALVLRQDALADEVAEVPVLPLDGLLHAQRCPRLRAEAGGALLLAERVRFLEVKRRGNDAPAHELTDDLSRSAPVELAWSLSGEPLVEKDLRQTLVQRATEDAGWRALQRPAGEDVTPGERL